MDTLIQQVARRRPLIVAEVGCADGAFRRRLPSGVRYVGIDLVPVAPSHVAVVQADACALPLRRACVDVLVARGVLHHVDTLTNFCAEAARVLAPKGALLAVDGRPMREADAAMMQRELLASGLSPEPHTGVDPDELSAVLSDFGLSTQWQADGSWTFATPPYANRTYATEAFLLVAERA